MFCDSTGIYKLSGISTAAIKPIDAKIVTDDFYDLIVEKTNHMPNKS